ncbi:Hypothetical_protein [Hexamita inflata]|uniref:Hypothetical_protein n=1 Tax=Hexamita inflata TaxID=28002 RepID=A0AA86TJD3_9EUKA|nr:Hypothetical protein HINF_LOCUS8114 [Hexamita inflata]
MKKYETMFNIQMMINTISSRYVCKNKYHNNLNASIKCLKIWKNTIIMQQSNIVAAQISITISYRLTETIALQTFHLLINWTYNIQTYDSANIQVCSVSPNYCYHSSCSVVLQNHWPVFNQWISCKRLNCQEAVSMIFQPYQQWYSCRDLILATIRYVIYQPQQAQTTYSIQNSIKI